jgi:Subtilase family
LLQIDRTRLFMTIRVGTLLVLLAATIAAHAQIRLPSAALPAVPALPASPLQGLPLQGQALAQTLDQADARVLERLTSVRKLTVDRLVRGNRRVVDTDPRGDPIVRGEILALFSSDPAREHALAAGFRIARDASADATDVLRLVVLTAPANQSAQRALDTLRTLDPDGAYDYNHIYTQSGSSDPAAPNPAASALTAPPPSSELPASSRMRVGLLDTGVASSHPVFHDSVVHAWGCADKVVPGLHGTAVASLLVARTGAEVYAADVYCGSPTGGAVDAIVAALGWLAAQHVAVINVSLVGPKNAMLERAVAALVARGHLLVAAVGNDGPAAPPLYPAAYPHVVGVTGVDAARHVLVEALRGPQVTFAATGADIKAANIDHGFSSVRGTSFAAPTVAALLAERLRTPDATAATAAVSALADRAVDLGAPGKDVIYGFGLVGHENHMRAN